PQGYAHARTVIFLNVRQFLLASYIGSLLASVSRLGECPRPAYHAPGVPPLRDQQSVFWLAGSDGEHQGDEGRTCQTDTETFVEQYQGHLRPLGLQVLPRHLSGLRRWGAEIYARQGSLTLFRH